MKTETALNHCNNFVTTLHDCFSEYFSYQQILDKVNEKIYKTPEWKRVPQWVRERINARFSERIDSLHRYGIVKWALWKNEKGENISGWDNLPQNIKQEFRDNKRTGFHYWVNSGVDF